MAWHLPSRHRRDIITTPTKCIAGTDAYRAGALRRALFSPAARLGGGLELEDGPAEVLGHLAEDGVVGLELVAPLEEGDAVEHVVQPEDLEAAVEHVRVREEVGARLGRVALEGRLHLQEEVAQLLLDRRREARRPDAAQPVRHLRDVVVRLAQPQPAQRLAHAPLRDLLGPAHALKKYVLDIDDVSTTDDVHVILRVRAGVDLAARNLVEDLELSRKITLSDLNFWGGDDKLVLVTESRMTSKAGCCATSRLPL